MGLLAKIKKIFGLNKKKKMLKVQVICNKCGEEINSVFRKNYDFQPSYGTEEYDYAINKQLVCPGCYNSLDLKMELNQRLKILNSKLEGGSLKIEGEQSD
ncbi:hypothetical protein Halha_1513 [Halobacteroides halobius DSM 5150]|uniref:Uncharacterized protein n=1 Tax=Halobacteroides halobius (strain ATCC 35273 / DSM 5150 / MD-1) TaxID=748449 RepID=L0KAQ8_HALHC|nr:hypothetical protein [Halobacteroides halobius]AGB41454.1 hypothetical protein Halha_1513 [Halobacteroides halobius DSM 5150]